MGYDIYLVGVGGQGILTIGEILAEALREEGTPVNFFPSKGMAQRGGFVKAQLRLGRSMVGPNIPEKGADLVLAMEESEALKAVRYVKPGGDFLLLEDRWLPMSVILKKESYPALEKIQGQIQASQAKLYSIDLAHLPAGASPNLFLLGAALHLTPLGQFVQTPTVQQVIEQRWPKAARRNRATFQAGLATAFLPVEGVQS